jgi:hypothetical protein
MTLAFLPQPTHVEWKTLYRAAILETNRRMIREKVSEAESAVIARGRELFYCDGAEDEREALDDALYALRALRSACEHTQNEAA